MGDIDRDRLRVKQNRLLELAKGRYKDDIRISDYAPGSPTIGQLRDCIFPQWEYAIDLAIQSMEK